MSESLKSQILKVATALGTTPGALYEVQRALVTQGLLRSRSGRGRGSGVLATPEALALVIVSWLANQKPAQTCEAEQAIRKYHKGV